MISRRGNVGEERGREGCGGRVNQSEDWPLFSGCCCLVR